MSAMTRLRSSSGHSMTNGSSIDASTGGSQSSRSARSSTRSQRSACGSASAAGGGPARSRRWREAGRGSARLSRGSTRSRDAGTGLGEPGEDALPRAEPAGGSNEPGRVLATPRRTTGQMVPEHTHCGHSCDAARIRSGHSRSGASITPRHNRWLRPSREIRRSVLEQPLSIGPFEAQNRIFCRVAVFWRMRGEVQQPRTVAPGHEGMGAVCGTAPPTSSGPGS